MDWDIPERIEVMVREAKYKMSEERLQELKDELVYLQTVREKEVAQ